MDTRGMMHFSIVLEVVSQRRGAMTNNEVAAVRREAQLKNTWRLPQKARCGKRENFKPIRRVKSFARINNLVGADLNQLQSKVVFRRYVHACQIFTRRREAALEALRHGQ